MTWEIVIGLETHVQLATQSKLFSGSATAYGASPNTQANVVDLAMPGVLPVLNKTAVEMAVKFGLAVNAKVNQRSEFARKNYFYPDLPKGYQISQNDLPIIGTGVIEFNVNGNTKSVRLHRAHLEEDAGKSVHGLELGITGIDLNRAGTPLLEIVTEPDMRSSDEAIAYLKTLHSLVKALKISDANMQEGSFRCDVNISIRRQGDEKLGTRTELKNLNSFRFIEKAIQFESKRQIDLLQSGHPVVQETRLYDEQKQITKSMRSKEDAHDYRYFPDPDLLPIVISDQFIENIRKTLPELPQQKISRYQTEFKLSADDAQKIVGDMDLASFFEDALTKTDNTHAKTLANWLVGDISALVNKDNTALSKSQLTTTHVATLIQRIKDQTISTSSGRQILIDCWQDGGNVDNIIEQKGLKQISDSGELEKMIDDIIAKNPSQVSDYKNGKTKLMAFFVGQVMKVTKGKANPTEVNQLLMQKL